MNDINYRTFNSELIDQVIDIYEKNGWSAYKNDKVGLINSFENSIYILGAFDEDDLIGFIRCVGDGEQVILIQDLILDPSYFRRGIGKYLYE